MAKQPAFTAPASVGPPPASAPVMPSHAPPGVQAPIEHYNYTPHPSGTYIEDGPGRPAPIGEHQISAAHPLSVVDLRHILDAAHRQKSQQAIAAGRPVPRGSPSPR